MKIVQRGKKRKAISPVLATVILIAITLIAAIAVAGFVFGLFGSFTSGPRVSMVSANLAHTGAVGGTLVFTNSGSVDATILSATITYSGSPNTPLALPATTTIAATGAAITITLPVETLTGAIAGEAFTVNLVIQPGGGSVSGTGTFT